MTLPNPLDDDTLARRINQGLAAADNKYAEEVEERLIADHDGSIDDMLGTACCVAAMVIVADGKSHEKIAEHLQVFTCMLLHLIKCEAPTFILDSEEMN